MSQHRTRLHHRRVQARFDAWSDSQSYRRLGRWLAYIQSYVLDQIDWSRTEKVLDIACGGGLAVVDAARRLAGKPGARAVGVDLSRRMLGPRQGRPGDLRAAHFVNGSAHALPCASDQFDVAFCTIAFHHFFPSLTVLEEIKRVLKPGGRLLIADPCRDQSLVVWSWDLVHRIFEKGHVRYYRTSEIRGMLTDAGFADIELSVAHPSFREVGKIANKAAVFSAYVPPPPHGSV